MRRQILFRTLLLALGMTIIAAPGEIRAQGVQTTAPTQTAAKKAFDVVSIVERNAQSSDNVIVGIRITPGRLVDQCANLQALISFAFDLPPLFQARGMPDWASGGACGPGNHANTYEVQATMPANTTVEQTRQMMQTLLADRFKMVSHWETKDMPLYVLVVGKDGFKLKPVDPNAPPAPAPALGPCPQDDAHCHILPLPAGSISVLASFLERFLRRPVIDQTGLTGKYDISLKWASDTAADSSLPSLPAALREKFGLELKSETGPVQTLVIDQVEKPTPN